jgi:hypothetical protein
VGARALSALDGVPAMVALSVELEDLDRGGGEGLVILERGQRDRHSRREGTE